MSMMQEKMYMDVDDVCAILGVSKTYACGIITCRIIPAGRQERLARVKENRRTSGCRKSSMLFWKQ